MYLFLNMCSLPLISVLKITSFQNIVASNCINNPIVLAFCCMSDWDCMIYVCIYVYIVWYVCIYVWSDTEDQEHTIWIKGEVLEKFKARMVYKAQVIVSSTITMFFATFTLLNNMESNLKLFPYTKKVWGFNHERQVDQLVYLVMQGFTTVIHLDLFFKYSDIFLLKSNLPDNPLIC